MINMLKASLWAVSFSLFALNVFAQTCGTQPTCEELGFVYDSTKCSTASGTSLKCPYDQTKLFCVEQDLEAGMILYSDKTVSKEVISEKTPIGIVFDPEKRLAIALRVEYNTAWGGMGRTVQGLTACYSNDNLSSCDPDGKANTAKIIRYGRFDGIEYPAAEYCYNYSTEGTNAGDWFLPSLVELRSISANRDAIDTTLSLLGRDSLSSAYFHSSNEYNTTHTWMLKIRNGWAGYFSKFGTTSNEVLPVLAL